MKFREPLNGYSHLIGAVLALVGSFFLIWQSVRTASTWHVVSFSIFGSTLILLYTASVLYHSLPLSEKGKEIFRRIDHIMIFFLIAGTYTPICLVNLRGPWGWSLFGVIWGLAVSGFMLKVFWFSAPRALSTAIYVVMGWMAVIALWPIIQTVSGLGLFWLVLGGLLYTIGGIIYGIKKPNITKTLGFHELFHFFVLGGSVCHFLMMWYSVLPVLL